MHWERVYRKRLPIALCVEPDRNGLSNKKQKYKHATMKSNGAIYKSNSIYPEHYIYRGIPAYTGNQPEKRGIPAHTPGKPPDIGLKPPDIRGYTAFR